MDVLCSTASWPSGNDPVQKGPKYRKTHPSICIAQVSFHVNNGAGRITATYKPRATRTLCDGKWHTLHAHKSKHRIVLTVDGDAVRAESPHTHSTSADTNDPIYVGGYPGMCDSPFGLSTQEAQSWRGVSAENHGAAVERYIV